jgi:hypothetical protein
MPNKRFAALGRPDRTDLARGLLAAAVVAILGVTLLPVSGADPAPFSDCLICGGRGVADATLNVILFMPLGAAFALLGYSWRHATLAALLLSLAIELTQVVVPGRDPSWGDLLFNTLGGTLGSIALGGLCRSFALPQAARAGLWFAAITGAVGVFALTGFLAQPALPSSTYYGQWAAYLGSEPWYHFHVVDASVADEPLPPRRLVRSDRVREILSSGPRIDVSAIALPRSSPSRRVVGIYDANLREIVRLASTGPDLVLSYRMRATTLRLDQPQLRLDGVLRGIRAGDAVRVVISGQWQRPCVLVNRLSACTAGLTLGSGWRFLLDVAGLPTWLRSLVDAAWVFALALPVGLWSGSRSRAALGGAIVVFALLVLPAPLNLVATRPLELVGGVLGVALGFLSRNAFQAGSGHPRVSPVVPRKSHTPHSSSEILI